MHTRLFASPWIGALLVFTAVKPVHAGGALDALASEAAPERGELGPALVVAAPVVADRPTHGDALAMRAASLVAAQLPGDAAVHPHVASLAAARAAAGSSKKLVFVRVSLARGDVSMAVDVYRPVGVWDRIRSAAPPSAASSKSSKVKVDAQVRAFLPPLELERAQPIRFRHDQGDVLAAACADIGSEGVDELVLVSRHDVTLGELRGGSFRALRSVPWSALAAKAQVPAREPLGTAAFVTDAVDLGSTDYGGVELGFDLALHRRLAGLPVSGIRGPVCLTPQPAAGAYEGAPIDCAPSRDPKPALAVPAPRYDAFDAGETTTASGTRDGAVAVREPGGRIWIKQSDETAALDGSFGVPLALVDLDEDAAPELVTTTDRRDDAVDISTLLSHPLGTRPRLHLDLGEPVRALAACPAGPGGAPGLVVVLPHEIWLVRAREAAGFPGGPP